MLFRSQAFDRSYQESPFYNDFQSTTTNRNPIDWHVNLGNECNLACKMCHPAASSKVVNFYRKHSIETVQSNKNWTSDDRAWHNFEQSVLETKNLNRIHFMGGEVLLNKRFRKFLKFLLENRPTVSLSFVTNGTLIDQDLINTLRCFRSCDIEISLESIEIGRAHV